VGWTLDAGALIAADRNDRRFWKLRDQITAEGRLAFVPAVVLTEVWRGARNANLARALLGCEIDPVDIQLAKAAGILCGLTSTDDPVDALVVASAARRGDDIVTTDPEGLRALAAVATGVGKILDLNAL
jgi:predicted nucleic acid-binding protein